ncbi:MAG: hypothetical protein ISS35_01495 [Kiritimatiellae bacterium]|nr:hypothetical protein [Kiritimatiellia bacterium]
MIMARNNRLVTVTAFWTLLVFSLLSQVTGPCSVLCYESDGRIAVQYSYDGVHCAHSMSCVDNQEAALQESVSGAHSHTCTDISSVSCATVNSQYEEDRVAGVVPWSDIASRGIRYMYPFVRTGVSLSQNATAPPSLLLSSCTVEMLL